MSAAERYAWCAIGVYVLMALAALVGLARLFFVDLRERAK